MAALIGDLYGMNRQANAGTQPNTVTIKGMMGIEEEEEKEEPSSSDLQVESVEEPQQEQNYPSIQYSQDQVDTADAIVEDALGKMSFILGSDYRFSPAEEKTLRTIVMNSDDPDTAGTRYLVASGLSSKFGIGIVDAYNNLDQIAEYYTGTSFRAQDVSWVQYAVNGFKNNDLNLMKSEYMDADFNGDVEKAEELRAKIEPLESELSSYESYMPKSAWDSFKKAIWGNLGYMAAPAIKGGLASTMLMAGAYLLANTNPITGIAANTLIAGAATVATATAGVIAANEMFKYTRGETYWELTHMEGGEINKNLAYTLANANGVMTALIETCVDGVMSRGLGLITGKAAKQIGLNSLVDLSKKGVASRFANAAWEWVTGGLDEGILNELPEYVVDETLKSIYKSYTGIEDKKLFSEYRDEAIESVKQGIMVGLVYGGLGIPFSMKAQTNTALNLRRTANGSQSYTDFLAATQDMKPDEVSQEDFDTARQRIYEASVNQRQEIMKNVAGGTVLESVEIAQQELYNTVDENGEERAKALPDGSVKRDVDNNLEHEVTQEHDGSYTVAFGDKDTGAVYGTVQIDSDGTDITVKSVRVRPGYEAIRGEMVLDSVDSIQSSETNVIWNPTTPGLQSVKQNLIDINPKGKDAGLNYEFRAKGKNADISGLASQISNAMPGLSQEESVVAARVYSIADNGGTLTSVNKGKVIADISEMTDEQLQGRTAQDFRGASSKAKALIYAGQNSDFSTFNHELFHVVTSQRQVESMALSKAVADTVKDEVSAEHLRSFISDHKQIWGDGFDIDSVMESLSSIDGNASTWTVPQEENLAKLYEAYRSSDNSQLSNLPDGVKSILRKIAEFMNKVYGTLRDSVPLNENIAKAYDDLMGFSGTSQASPASSTMQNTTYQETVSGGVKVYSYGESAGSFDIKDSYNSAEELKAAYASAGIQLGDDAIFEYKGHAYAKSDLGFNYSEDNISSIRENVSSDLTEARQGYLFNSDELTGGLFADLFNSGEDTGTRGDLGRDTEVRGVYPRDFIPGKGWNGKESNPTTVENDFRDFGFVSFIGADVNSITDLVQMYSIYRNPLLEYFHLVQLKDGKIVRQLAITSGVSGMTPTIPGNVDPATYKEQINSIDYDEAYLMHNHPSGNVDPSRADIMTTGTYIRSYLGDKFKGHIIFDHTQYTLLTRSGATQLSGEQYDVPSGYHQIQARQTLSGTLSNPNQIAEAYRRLSDGGSAAFYLSNNHAVVEVENLDVPKMDSVDKLRQFMDEMVQKTSDKVAKTQVIMLNDKSVFDSFDRWYGMVNWPFLDVILVDQEGKMVTSLVNKGTIDNSSRYDWQMQSKFRQKAMEYAWNKKDSSDTLFQGPIAWTDRHIKNHKNFIFDTFDEVKQWSNEVVPVRYDGVALVSGMDNSQMPRIKEIGMAKLLNLIFENDMLIYPSTFKVLDSLDSSGNSKVPDGINGIMNGRFIEFKRNESDTGKANHTSIAGNILKSIMKSDDVFILSKDPLDAKVLEDMWESFDENIKKKDIKSGEHHVLIMDENAGTAMLYVIKKETGKESVSRFGQALGEHMLTRGAQINSIIQEYFVNNDNPNRRLTMKEYSSLESDVKPYGDNDMVFKDSTEVYDAIKSEDDAMDSVDALSDDVYEVDDIFPDTSSFDAEMPADWDPSIYNGEEIEDKVDYEEELSSEAPKSEPGKMPEAEDIHEGNPNDVIIGRDNLDQEWKEFAKNNAPQVTYEGTEEEKDRQFVEAIRNPMTMRQYLGIIGEAIMLDTTSLNGYYEQQYNDKFKRWSNVRMVEPFVDQNYRVGLQNRVLKQVTDNDVRKAAKYAVEGKAFPRTTGLESKVMNKLEENARLYRNVIAPLISDKDMLPSTLIESERKLDLPGRETLDLMSVEELADIARQISRDDIVDKIQNGTLKFGNDIDEKQYKAVTDALKYQQSQISSGEKTIRQLESSVDALENGKKEVTEKLMQRDDIIASASTLLDTFRNVIVGKDMKSSADAVRYGELFGILNNLDEESEYQKRATAKGSRDKGKAIGAKTGTAQWMRDMASLYPELFVSKNDGRQLAWSDGKSTNDNAEIRENMKAMRDATVSEMRDVRARMLDSTIRQIMVNGESVNKALKSISDSIGKNPQSLVASTASGYETQIRQLNSENESIMKAVAELKKEISSKDAGIESLTEKVDGLKQTIAEQKKDARTAEHRIKDLTNRLEKAKEKIREMRDEKEAEVKAVKDDVRNKRREQRKLDEIRNEKAKIARSIMKPVNLNTIDYDTSAEAIMALQALVDPQFRRDWVYDLSQDPMQASGYDTMSIDQAKEFFNKLDDAQRIDIMQYLNPDLVARLTEQKKPLNDWTVDELKQLANQVEDLRNRGREVLAAKRSYEKERVHAIQRSILKSLSPKRKGKTLPGSLERLAERRTLMGRLAGALYSTYRPQELAQLVDGGFGNKGYGYKLLVDDKRYHQNNEARAIEKRVESVRKYMTDKALDQMVKKIEFNDEGLKNSYTIDELAYVYLSKRDKSNRDAVAYGALLDETEKGTRIDSHIDHLTGESVNDYLVRSKDLIEDDEELVRVGDRRYNALWNRAKQELETRGLIPLVEAISDDFNNPENTRRLNRACIEAYNRPLDARDYYLAIKRKDLTGDNFENDLADSIFNLNTNSISRDPEKGFTISRIEISPRNQRNVDLSLINGWDRAVKDQEHLIENAAYVKQLRSVFESYGAREVIRAMNEVYSPALSKEINEYIELIANPHSADARHGSDSFFKTIRGRTGAAYLGWKMSGIVLQGITSPMPSLSEIDPAHLLGAYLQIASNPIKTINDINERSIFMKNRTMNQIIDEAVQRQNQWDANKFEKFLNKQEEIGQIGLTLVDRYAVAGGWLAMYQKGLKENLSNGMDTGTAEAAAVQRADSFILRTQPVGDPTEMSSLFRGKNEAQRTVLQFQASLNVIWNNLLPNMIGFKKNREFGKMAGTAFGYAIAGVILGLVANGFDDDDDGKDKAKKIAYWMLTQEIDSFPVFGSSIDSMVNKLITGESKYMGNGISISPIFDKASQAVNAVSNEDWKKTLEKAAEAGGILAGLPVSGFKQGVKAITGEPGALLGR